MCPRQLSLLPQRDGKSEVRALSGKGLARLTGVTLCLLAALWIIQLSANARSTAPPTLRWFVMVYVCTLWFKKNAPTLADYNYDPVQSMLIIFSKLFVNDHKSCLVVKFSTSPHICCHYTL